MKNIINFWIRQRLISKQLFYVGNNDFPIEANGVLGRDSAIISCEDYSISFNNSNNKITTPLQYDLSECILILSETKVIFKISFKNTEDYYKSWNKKKYLLAIL